MIKRSIDSWLLIVAISLIISACNISKQISRKEAAVFLSDSSIITGHIGISIFEPATNNYWYNYNATKNYLPASNTKLFTLYAALKYLGDSLTAAKYLQIGESLFIQPNADPTFLHPDFVRQPLYDLMKSAPNAIIINTDNDVDCFGKGWTAEDFDQGYMAEKSKFPVFGNMVWFNRATANSNIIINPQFFADKISYKNKPPFLRNRNENIFYIDTVSSTKKIPFITNNYSTQLSILSKLLNKPVSRIEMQNKNYRILKSQPTDSVLIPMMHRSDNFFAEQLLLMVSNQVLGFMDEEKIINQLLKTDLNDLPQIPVWADGSGLSRYNLFTPQSLVYILNKMQQEFGLDRMKKILPTGGEGTLKNYYIRDSNFIYAKTGSLSNQFTISGYLITRKNKLLLFSMLSNNFKGSTAAVRRAMERFLMGIREQY